MARRLIIIALAALLAVPAVFAADAVLTDRGALYVVMADDVPKAIALSRRIGKARTTLIVPASADEASESNVQLEYDRLNDRVYVLWTRETGEDTEILVSSIGADGAWSDALVIASANASESLGNLRTALTRAQADGGEITILHAAWWRKATDFKPEYGLIAFDGVEHVSTVISDLDELADLTTTLSMSGEVEPLGKALYPPMGMTAVGNGVDVVFGASRSTKMTRVRLDPRPNARVWRPGKTGGGHGMPPSQLASQNTDSVEAMIVRDRVILYTFEDRFRFVVYADGKWTPVRSITLDETLTREQILAAVDRLSGD